LLEDRGGDDKDKTGRITKAYREAMDKRMVEVAKGNIPQGIISGELFD
jgi:hypothetical protein